jgi:hypothetical protein
MKSHPTTFLACCILAAASAVAAAADAKPNVIIILTDDQGFGELGATGNPLVRTPHIDRFAAQAASLTKFHVMPVCPPYPRHAVLNLSLQVLFTLDFGVAVRILPATLAAR